MLIVTIFFHQIKVVYELFRAKVRLGFKLVLVSNDK